MQEIEAACVLHDDHASLLEVSKTHDHDLNIVAEEVFLDRYGVVGVFCENVIADGELYSGIVGLIKLNFRLCIIDIATGNVKVNDCCSDALTVLDS